MKFFPKCLLVSLISLLSTVAFAVETEEINSEEEIELPTSLTESVFGLAGQEILDRIGEIKKAFHAQDKRPLIAFIATIENKSLWGTYIREAFLDLTVRDLQWVVENTSKENRDILFTHFFDAGNYGERNIHAREILGFKEFITMVGGVLGYYQKELKYNFITYCIANGHNDLFQKIVNFAPTILVSPNQIKDPASDVEFIAWLHKGVIESNVNIIGAAKILTDKAILDAVHAKAVASDFFLLAVALHKIEKISDQDLLILRER